MEKKKKRLKSAHARNTSVSNCWQGGLSYIGNDCVTIVRGDKVLDLAGRGYAEVVPADEMRSKIELGRVGARGAVGLPIDSVLSNSCHVVFR